MDLKIIGSRIKQLRKSSGLTQEEFAKKIGRSKSAIQKYEAGQIEIPYSVIESIAKLFNVNVSAIAYEEPDKIERQIALSKFHHLLAYLEYSGITAKPFPIKKKTDNGTEYVGEIIEIQFGSVLAYKDSQDVRKYYVSRKAYESIKNEIPSMLEVLVRSHNDPPSADMIEGLEDQWRDVQSNPHLRV